MSMLAEATLMDGRKIPYVIQDNPPRGGMKHTYFAPDRSYVVQFFNDPAVGNDPNMRKRLQSIIGKYNPTLSEQNGGAKGNTEISAAYFSSKYCWPTAIVQYPEFGIVCPAYPSNFFFGENASPHIALKGKDKKSNWFTTRNRRFLEQEELGDFRSMLKMSISLARAIRRMHQAGLAHSDLSCNNVLIDPKSGECVVIDIDSLVVPGVFPPEVAGTRGYIAPEVLATMTLPFGAPGRKLPSSYTDLHALAVLIYEYLLLRHPLMGPKIYSKESSEEDDFLAMGPQATFIEHPTDHSNRPDNLQMTIHDLGPYLEALFLKSFVEGLHQPDMRPTAMEWEKGLVKTWDLLHPCENPACAAGWFILHDVKHPVCPFCGQHVNRNDIVRLHLKRPIKGRKGQWVESEVLDLYHNMPLFEWHILSNIFPDEKAKRELQAYVCRFRGEWILVNYAVKGMKSPNGNEVPVGQAILLKHGTVFRASDDDAGYLIEVVRE